MEKVGDKMNSKHVLNLFKRRSMTPIEMNLNLYNENGNNYRDSVEEDTHSTHSSDNTEGQIIKHLRKYYDSMEIETIESTQHNITQKTNGLKCCICENKKGREDNYVVLSCNHVFHVYCLISIQFHDIYNFHIIDNEYFSSRKCVSCEKSIQMEELMFLHSKFLNGTKDKIEQHNSKIESLENKLKDVKEELRVCYDYKHKLEHEREKSKQIVANLMTMM